MAAYFTALFTAIAYGLGVLVGMTIISYILVTIGGAQKAPVSHDDHHHGHGHEPAPKPAPAVAAAPAAAEPAPAAAAEPAPAAETAAPEEKPEASA